MVIGFDTLLAITLKDGWKTKAHFSWNLFRAVALVVDKVLGAEVLVVLPLSSVLLFLSGAFLSF